MGTHTSQTSIPSMLATREEAMSQKSSCKTAGRPLPLILLLWQEPQTRVLEGWLLLHVPLLLPLEAWSLACCLEITAVQPLHDFM